MVERATINQVVQVGIEGTPGTAVAATRRLTSLSLAPNIKSNIDMFRPMGYKYETVQAQNQEWAEGSVTGAPTYNELPYAYASLLTNPTVTQILDGATPTGAYRYVFDPSSTAADSPKTFTAEVGSSYRAHRVKHVLLNEFNLDFKRTGIGLGGNFISHRLEDAITLTPTGVTELPLIPIVPSQVDVFMDATSGGLGTTKLGRCLQANMQIGDRYGPLWVLDSSLESWATYLERAVNARIEFTVAADAQGMGLLSNVRNGTTAFFRIRALGPVIYTGGVTVRYSFTYDLAGKISDVGDFSDEDGLYAMHWTAKAVHDSTWGRAHKLEIVNTVEAL